MKLIPTRNAEPIRESDRETLVEMTVQNEWAQMFSTTNVVHLYDHFKFKAQSRYAKAKSFAEACQYLSLVLYIEHRALREHCVTV
jgi:hypothetical protein